MGNMIVSAGRGNQGGSIEVRQLGEPPGRLVVPPAYMQTTGELAIQCNTANYVTVLFGWTQEVDFALSSFSVYLAATAVPALLNWWVSEVDQNGDCTFSFPIQGENYPWGFLETGSTPHVWVRTTFNPLQLQRDKRYCLCFRATGSADVSFSARRQIPAIGSGHPQGCWSKTSTDIEGQIWSDLQQDSRPALLNVVLNSTPNHSPQLVYGRSTGKDVALYNGSKWESREIPEAGINLNCEGLPAETLYNIYLHDSSGTLALEAATTPRMISEGVEVKSEAPTHRYLGLVCPIERQTGLQAPIKVYDWMGVYNAYNRLPTFVGKPAPYAVATEGAGSDTNWVAISDFTAKFIAGHQCRFVSDFSLASVNGTRLTVLLDGAALSHVPISWTVHTSDLISVHAEFVLSEGCHAVCPAASGWPAFDYSLYDPIYGTSSLTGGIMA
ncbi:MAG: hypothetical protein ACLP5H_07020 [Desulfomonilaceae bacterium]